METASNFQCRQFFGVNCPIRVSSPLLLVHCLSTSSTRMIARTFFDTTSKVILSERNHVKRTPTMQATKRCKNYFISKVKLFHKQITGVKQSTAEENGMKKFLMEESRVKKHINLTMARFKSFGVHLAALG